MKWAAVIVGGGAGTRLRLGVSKALVPLKGVPLFLYSVRAFARVRGHLETVLVLPAGDIGAVTSRHGPALERARVTKIVPGGATRHQSVRTGVEWVDRRADVILIHDAARPFVTPELIGRVAAAAAKSGAALPAVQPAETVKWLRGRLRTIDRREIYLAQTPQGFRARAYRAALRALGRRAEAMTDDVQLFEALGRPVAIVPGEPANVKITVTDDLRRASRGDSGSTVRRR